MSEIPREQGSYPEDFNSEMAKLKVELDDLKQRVEDQGARIAELTTIKDQLQAENAALRQQLNELKRANGMDQDEQPTSEFDTDEHTTDEAEDDDFEVIVRNQEDSSEAEDDDFDVTVRRIQPRPPRQAPRQANAPEQAAKKTWPKRALGAFALAGAIGVMAGGAFSGLFKSGSTEVKADASAQDVAASVAKTPERRAMLDSSAAAPTVSEAVLKMHSTPSTIKANIVEIFNQKQRHVLDHRKGAMSSMASEFGPGQINALDAAETVAYSAQSSDSYATGLYNELNGRSVTDELPQGVTIQDARNYIESVMIAQGTQFSIQHPVHKLFRNHGMRGEHRFYANTINAEGQIAMFAITDDHGKSYYVKTQDECFNLLNELKGAGHVRPNVQIVVPGPHVGPTPGTHPRPKHDSNNTPAGVPGEPRGSGGNGQEPSRPHAGKAPSSVHQPQQQTPPRVSTHGETNSNKPAETGVDHGTNGPATRGNGTQSPAGKINEGTTPTGD